MLSNETIDILFNPYTKTLLKLQNNALVDEFGNRAPIIDGITDFLVFEKINGSNKKYQ